MDDYMEKQLESLLKVRITKGHGKMVSLRVLENMKMKLVVSREVSLIISNTELV